MGFGPSDVASTKLRLASPPVFGDDHASRGIREVPIKSINLGTNNRKKNTLSPDCSEGTDSSAMIGLLKPVA